MFGIGYQEMFVILVVAMIVFGPSRLPEMAGQVGRWVRDFRRMSSDLTGEFEKTFAEVEEVKKSFKRELDAIQDEVDGVGKSARGDLKKTAAKSSSGAKKPAALGSGATKPAAGNSLKGKLLGTNGKAVSAANGSDGALAVLASKADPLADVSFFDADFVALKSVGVSTNGKGHGDDDALARVRRRRAAAAYAQRAST